MLKLSQKGLSIQLDTFTGTMSLRYTYPIKRDHYSQFLGVATTLGANVESIKGKTYMVYSTNGNSDHCFSAFRAVQKKLMLMSRTFKVMQLSREISNLQQ